VKLYRVECSGCGATYDQALGQADVAATLGPSMCGACGATAIRVWVELRDQRRSGRLGRRA
jgi:rubredoxin